MFRYWVLCNGGAMLNVGPDVSVKEQIQTQLCLSVRPPCGSAQINIPPHVCPLPGSSAGGRSIQRSSRLQDSRSAQIHCFIFYYFFFFFFFFWNNDEMLLEFHSPHPLSPRLHFKHFSFPISAAKLDPAATAPLRIQGPVKSTKFETAQGHEHSIHIQI